MALVMYKWLLAGSLALLHPFFVSVTEINHNARDKMLEISCKTFTDDLEKSIEKTANVKLNLFNVKDKAQAENGNRPEHVNGIADSGVQTMSDELARLRRNRKRTT